MFKDHLAEQYNVEADDIGQLIKNPAFEAEAKQYVPDIAHVQNEEMVSALKNISGPTRLLTAEFDRFYKTLEPRQQTKAEDEFGAGIEAVLDQSEEEGKSLRVAASKWFHERSTYLRNFHRTLEDEIGQRYGDRKIQFERELIVRVNDLDTDAPRNRRSNVLRYEIQNLESEESQFGFITQHLESILENTLGVGGQAITEALQRHADGTLQIQTSNRTTFKGAGGLYVVSRAKEDLREAHKIQDLLLGRRETVPTDSLGFQQIGSIEDAIQTMYFLRGSAKKFEQRSWSKDMPDPEQFEKFLQTYPAFEDRNISQIRGRMMNQDRLKKQELVAYNGAMAQFEQLYQDRFRTETQKKELDIVRKGEDSEYSPRDLLMGLRFDILDRQVRPLSSQEYEGQEVIVPIEGQFFTPQAVKLYREGAGATLTDEQLSRLDATPGMHSGGHIPYTRWRNQKRTGEIQASGYQRAAKAIEKEYPILKFT